MTIDPISLNELKVAIADSLYVQIENWHLYLGDAGLAEKLSIECIANFQEGSSNAARIALENVKVSLGGGTFQLPLSQLIPSGQIYDLEEILDPYCR